MSLQTAAAAITDARFGPIIGTQRHRLGGAEPRWWLATSQLARHPVGNPFSEEPAAGAGTSLDPDQATDRAIGEALERYSALNIVPNLVDATLRESGMHERWARCADVESAPPSLTSPPVDRPLQCVMATSLTGSAAVPIPAGHMLLQYHPPATEPLVALSISTGLAFHPNPATALWNALCEVIERDAVMSMWWIHRRCPELDTSDAPHQVQERLARLAARGMTARLFDVRTELGVPCAFATLTSDTFPHLVVGAAAKADAADACTKSLDELVAMRVALNSDRRAGGRAQTQDHPDRRPQSLIDHALRYANRQEHDAFAFLSPADLVPYKDFHSASCPAPTDMHSLRAVARRIEAHDVTILWADMTSPEVTGLGTVVRVVVPELVPLSPRDDVRWLGTQRLIDRSARAGLPAVFTDHPHPFA